MLQTAENHLGQKSKRSSSKILTYFLVCIFLNFYSFFYRSKRQPLNLGWSVQWRPELQAQIVNWSKINSNDGDRTSERGIWRSEVWFLMRTQNFFFVPRSWQDLKNILLASTSIPRKKFTIFPQYSIMIIIK